MTHLRPRLPAPPLAATLADGSTWSLASRAPQAFTLVVFYRGVHCSICKTYLGRLEALCDDFLAQGVEPVAASANTPSDARRAIDDWGLDRLPVVCDVPLSAARDWGLYVSSARKDGEPAKFFEPGLFLVAADGTLFYASTQNMAFGRPDLDEVLRWTGLVQQNAIPARGEVDVAGL